MVPLAATDNWLEYTVRLAVDARLLHRGTHDKWFTRFLDDIDAPSGTVCVAEGATCPTSANVHEPS